MRPDSFSHPQSTHRLPQQEMAPYKSEFEQEYRCKKINVKQGGITCGAIDEPRKSSKAIDEHVIINFRDKNVVIARFRDKNGGFLFYR